MRFTRRATAAATLATALLALLSAGALADDVTTTAGKKINGKLVAVDAQGITFVSADAKVPISARDIIVVDLGQQVRPVPKDTTYSEIELTDGSVFKVAKFALKGKKFETDPLFGAAEKTAPALDIPMGTVFSAMKRADDVKHRAAWGKMLATRGKRDLYVTQLETGLTYQQGTVHEGSADGRNVSFEKETGGAPGDLLQSRSVGLVFYQPQPATLPATLCRVFDVYGNALNAAAIAITPEGVVVTTVAGATVKYPSTAALSRLDYAQGNVAYLSDLATRRWRRPRSRRRRRS